MADKEVQIPRPRTKTLDADELEEIAAAASFAKPNTDDFFISPETGRPVRKSDAKAHADYHYGASAADIAAGRLPEQKARRDYIVGQYVEPKEEAK